MSNVRTKQPRSQSYKKFCGMLIVFSPVNFYRRRKLWAPGPKNKGFQMNGLALFIKSRQEERPHPFFLGIGHPTLMSEG